MVKKKVVSHKEIMDRYVKGFKALKYGTNRYYTIDYRPECTLANYKLTYTFEVLLIKLRKLNCTYVAITCRGFLGFLSASDNDKTLVLRVDGIINSPSDVPRVFMTAALDEQYFEYEKKSSEKCQEEES